MVVSAFFFLFSVLLAVLVARIKNIPLISTYSVFLAFNSMYNAVPWIICSYGDASFSSLLYDGDTVSTQICLAALSNIAFVAAHFCVFRKVHFDPPVASFSSHDRRVYTVASLPVFVICCALSAKYGWHAYTHAMVGGESALGGMYTLAAYVKYLFVAIYLFYVYRCGFDKWAAVLLVEHVILMGIDGGRTTAFPVLIITAIVLDDRFQSTTSRRKLYAMTLCGILALVVTRSLVIEQGSMMEKLLVPLAVEGAMGAYPSLQSIYAVKHCYHLGLTYGSSYVIDPLLWMMPQYADRNGYLTLQVWQSRALSCLPDAQFAPMGGFYYIAEAFSAFSYFGPPLVAAVFGMALACVERGKNEHRLFYLLWTGSFGILFVKAIFGNVFKVFVVLSFFTVGLVIISHLVRLLSMRARLIATSIVAVKR